MHETEKHPRKPGGRSVHVLWPIMLTLSWETDFALIIGPVLVDAWIIFLLANLFAIFT